MMSVSNDMHYSMPKKMMLPISKIGFMQDLLRGIKKILAGEIKKTSQHEAVIV